MNLFSLLVRGLPASASTLHYCISFFLTYPLPRLLPPCFLRLCLCLCHACLHTETARREAEHTAARATAEQRAAQDEIDSKNAASDELEKELTRVVGAAAARATATRTSIPLLPPPPSLTPLLLSICGRVSKRAPPCKPMSPRFVCASATSPPLALVSICAQAARQPNILTLKRHTTIANLRPTC